MEESEVEKPGQKRLRRNSSTQTRPVSNRSERMCQKASWILVTQIVRLPAQMVNQTHLMMMTLI